MQPENAVVRKDGSSSALQERNLMSKFLYRSLQTSLDAEACSSRESNDIKSLSLETLPQLPDPSLDQVPNFMNTEKFVRNYLWTFEDIRMMIGSNMPIFGDQDHPCVSLRLRDMKKPINILTGMDYWLDNLMCQVPEVVMCYHLDGIVQKYELLKTEDLPNIEGSSFSPKIVKNIAQNILAFLKSNAAKEGHTYWLFKAKDDEIVKLYDLTSLSQQDAGLDPKSGRKKKDDCDLDKTKSSDKESEENPFQTPVSMLLYRLARNILESGNRGEEEGTVRELLTHCVSLLDSEKFPHIATSAHFLLSELYLPDGTDPAKPSFSDPSDTEDNIEDHTEAEAEYHQFNLDVSSLCKAGSVLFPREKRHPRISETAESRCNTALKHIDRGLQFLSEQEARTRQREAELEKEKERQERENIKMSVPNQPIPMGFSASCKNDRVLVKRTRSVSEGSALKTQHKEITWTEYLKYLLLKKALLVFVTMAELFFNSKHLGRTLKCVKRAMNAHSMIQSLGGEDEARDCRPLLSFSLGVAGDSYMGFVYNWDRVPIYHEEYNTGLSAETSIAREIERYTTELDRDWIIKQPRDIREAMELAVKCYTRALELVENNDESLIRRLANVENELGVFFMNQGTALLDQAGAGDKEMMQPAIAGAKDLFHFSRKYLEQGIVKFESIKDASNTALLLSNTGRLSRLAGHLVSLAPSSEADQEFGSEEASHYRAAVERYQQALAVLGGRRVNPGIWESVSWELSSTLYTMGSQYQDQAPLSTMTRDQVEKTVTELMSGALKYCGDLGEEGERYMVRAGMVHHRLASLYHHSYRATLQEAESRSKKLRQLSELHYVKATQLFVSLSMIAQAIRTVLERAGLLEASLSQSKSDIGKSKVLLQILDIILENESILAKMIERDEVYEDQEESKEEKKMTETILQRLQFTLLSLVKSGGVNKNNKKKGDRKTPIEGATYKELYGETLKCSSSSPDFTSNLHTLLMLVKAERGKSN